MMRTDDSQSKLPVERTNTTPLASAAGSALPGLRSAEKMILTPADLNLCLGSNELKPCPFCGSNAMSGGERTENGRAIRWKIQCMGHDSKCVLIPNCFASVIGVDPDQETARKVAVERWNRRVPNTELSDGRGGHSLK